MLGCHQWRGNELYYLDFDCRGDTCFFILFPIIDGRT